MKKFWGLVTMATFAGIPAVAGAAPTLSEVLGASGITAAGYVDASYEAGFNKGQTIAYHTFDSDNNSFEMNQAAITLSYLPTDGFGGLVNVIAGSDAQVINGSYGSGSSDFAVTQAYVQWAHGPFTVIGGRFVTLSGAEVIDDTKNTNISRSFLFTLAEPFVHTGVRGAYKFGDSLTAYAGVMNSAASGKALDTDKHKTVETGLVFTPTSTISLAATNYYGMDGDTKNDYADAVASFTITPALQVVGNIDYARFLGGGVNAYVYGIAGYVNYQFTDAFKASLRGEYLKSKNYIAVGKDDGKTDLEEVTLTGDYSFTKSFDILGEFRYDFSGDHIYPNPNAPGNVIVDPETGATTANNDGVSENQGEVLIKAIWKFGTPTGS